MQAFTRIIMRYKLISISVAAVLTLLILFMVILAGKRKPAIRPPILDLRNHPIYSSYTFPEDERIICIGVQPLWIFSNNISEIMRRDAILRQNLQKMGLEIRFYAFLKGADLNYFVQHGDLDGGMCGDMPTLTIAATLDIIVPALIDQGFDDIVSRRPMLVSELKGKRIGYAFGSDAHHVLLEALASEGIDEDQVDLIPMDVTEMPGAMHDNDIDACATWEPTTSKILMQIPHAEVIHRSRYLGFLFFRRDVADRHPEAVRQIVAAEIRAIRWMLKSRDNLEQSCQWAIEAIKEFVRTRFELPPGRFADIVSQNARINMVPVISALDLQQDGHLHREFGFLKDLGKIPGTADWERVRTMFDRQIINHVLSNPHQYRLDEFISLKRGIQ